MHENNQDQHPEADDFDDLRLENEILKLKMQAESGASFQALQDIPPDVENIFLQQILAFDEAIKKANMVPLYDFIGRPDYGDPSQLDEPALKKEVKRLLRHLRKHDIELNFHREYPTLTMYRFITEEFFKQETSDVRIPGFIRGYIYEEFHPDHESDMRDTAGHFFYNWFNQDFKKSTSIFAPEMRLPGGIFIPMESFTDKLQSFFASFPAFPKSEFTISSVKFQWVEEAKKGLGYIEGAMDYEARMESGEILSFQGPFRLEMANMSGFWQIYYFTIPGFVW